MTSTLDHQVGQGAALRQDRIGNALVVHPEDAVSDEARDLALRIAADPENDIVVLDLPDGVPFAVWQSLVQTWPRQRRRGIRLVTCRSGPGAAGLTAQWLSQLLRCVVYAPDGHLTVGASGTVLAHSSPDSGWLRFRPGKPPVRVATRYPAPVWDTIASETRVLGANTRAEPLTAGLWIHDTRDPQRVERHRRLLETASAFDPEALTVVLGCPETPPVALEEVRRIWDDLTLDQRIRLRFAAYGPVVTPDGDRLGQALADTLAAPVVCFTGLPLTAPYTEAAYPVNAAGEPGWPAFVRELGFAPRILPVSLPRRPVVLSHRMPMDLGEEVARLTYQPESDVLVEIVEAGLWVRAPQAPDHAERLRGLPALPDYCAVVFEDSDPQTGTRLMQFARKLAEQLNDARVVSRVRPASELMPSDEDGFVMSAPPPPSLPEQWNGPTPLPLPSRAGTVTKAAAPEQTENSAIGSPAEVLPPTEEPQPVEASAPARPETRPAVEEDTSPELVVVPAPIEAETAPAAVEHPTPLVPVESPPAVVAVETRPAGVTAEVAAARETPEPPAPASSAPRVVDQDRELLRGMLALVDPWADVDALYAAVQRVLPGYPADRGLAEAVALRWYLSRGGAVIDPVLCNGDDGPHRPITVMAVAALARLPRYVGAVTYARTPGPEEWEMYQDAPLVTDWGFVHALAEPCALQDGDTDVVIWSLTGALTGLLEPEDDAGVTDRVVFTPGTTFKLLDLTPPADGRRGRILLREVGSDEHDGLAGSTTLSADREAAIAMLRELRGWESSSSLARTRPGATVRFDRLPGLV
ncbi:hypothetical protein [Pseudosporangium ferrugineum]|uniref:Uncharacterized protein n=1 Tax=Pseudosporangium ferrugineum TaxID=439699 RepID=A0A2T0S823_9ACTN|nr:hypothetical protein [Pseudosporangium ferrugineum]PRY29566.1 hypothetical protein CLV70_106287 [Pseudosporangium ferrugineum]